VTISIHQAQPAVEKVNQTSLRLSQKFFMFLPCEGSSATHHACCIIIQMLYHTSFAKYLFVIYPGAAYSTSVMITHTAPFRLPEAFRLGVCPVAESTPTHRSSVVSTNSDLRLQTQLQERQPLLNRVVEDLHLKPHRKSKSQAFNCSRARLRRPPGNRNVSKHPPLLS